MKFRLITIALLATAATHVNAQKLYVKAGLGYAFPHAGQTSDAFGNPINGSGSRAANGNMTYDYKKGSYAAGFWGNIGIGSMITQHIGAELNFNIGIATKKNEFEYTYAGGTSTTGVTTTYAKLPVLLNPCIVFQSGGKINLYGKGGIAIPLKAKIVSEDSWTESNGGGTDTYTWETETKNRISIGFTGAVGVKVGLTDKLSFWAEGSVLSMSLHAKEMEVVAATDNGFDYTGLIPANERITTFENEGTNIDPSTANVMPSVSAPFSNFGINVGVSFALAK